MDGQPQGRGAGGILRLGRLTVEHPEIFADFRELFHTGIEDVRLREACLLVRALLDDPRSRTAAAVAGWDYPASREWQLLAVLHDVVLSTTPGLKSPERHHLRRPWRNAGKPKRKQRPVAELEKILKPWR